MNVYCHYTVIDFDKINDNISDIGKFSCKKIQSNPFNEKNKDLDHLCFVEIYRTGRGGMYDHRPYSIIKPAMYLRWAIWNENPIIRHNTQYLFSALHNKDLRAIDYGIYATLKTTNIPNLNAGLLKQKIKNNDIQLENNLNSTMKAVRNSREYWSSIQSDLGAFDENLGPATWYFTVSSAEYNWNGLSEFKRKMNPNLRDVDKMSSNELIALDPVMVSVFF